jgi:hypothetical protein
MGVGAGSAMILGLVTMRTVPTSTLSVRASSVVASVSASHRA